MMWNLGGRLCAFWAGRGAESGLGAEVDGAEGEEQEEEAAGVADKALGDPPERALCNASSAATNAEGRLCNAGVMGER